MSTGENRGQAILVIRAEVWCRILLDGEPAGYVGPDERLRLEVLPGDHEIRAVAADGWIWDRVVRTPAGEQTIATVTAASAAGPAVGGVAPPPPPPPPPGESSVAARRPAGGSRKYAAMGVGGMVLLIATIMYAAWERDPEVAADYIDGAALTLDTIMPPVADTTVLAGTGAAARQASGAAARTDPPAPSPVAMQKVIASAPRRLGLCNGPIEITVSGGTEPILSWSPACGIKILFIEHGENPDRSEGQDAWAVHVTGDKLMYPPIRYGVEPVGAETLTPPTPLQPGMAYIVGVMANPLTENAGSPVMLGTAPIYP